MPLRITNEWTIWCDRCCIWVQESAATKLRFIQKMRRRGWRCVDKKGVCPDCSTDLKEGRTWEDISYMTKLRKPLEVHTRWLIRRDMPAVIAINEDGFNWTEEEFIRCLRQRNNIGMVSEFQEQVICQTVYELNRDHLHIINFSVDIKYRRLSVGRQMIQTLYSKLSSEPGRRNQIEMTVPEENLGMQLFAKRCGFFATGIHENGYHFVLRHHST